MIGFEPGTPRSWSACPTTETLLPILKLGLSWNKCRDMNFKWWFKLNLKILLLDYSNEYL